MGTDVSTSLRAKRSNPASFAATRKLDCFVASLLAMTVCGYPTRRVELLQFFSDDHTLRDKRKQSTGVEEPSASKRCSSTPLHWKPHFSRMLREAGLATRAAANRCSGENSSKK